VTARGARRRETAFLAQLLARRFAVKSTPRLLVPLGVLLLLVGGMCAYRSWSTPAREEKPGVQTDIDEGLRAEKLEARRQLLLWRNAEQHRIARDLLDGRCALREAARRFRALYHRGDPVLSRALREIYPGGSEEEGVCRWVIAYTLTILEDEPGTPELGARLKAELQEHLKAGTLRLTE
jgi:hypothetical protein